MQYVNSNYGILADEWYNIVFTRNGIAGKIYINGVEDVAASTNFIDLASSNTNYIGCTGSITQTFCGSIDQPRILNRAHTAKEVMDYYINPYSVYLDEDD